MYHLRGGAQGKHRAGSRTSAGLPTQYLFLLCPASCPLMAQPAVYLSLLSPLLLQDEPHCLPRRGGERASALPGLGSIQQNGAGLFLQYFCFAKGGAQGGLEAKTSRELTIYSFSYFPLFLSFSSGCSLVLNGPAKSTASLSCSATLPNAFLAISPGCHTPLHAEGPSPIPI